MANIHHANFSGIVPSDEILQAAQNSHSSVMHFGARTFDARGNPLSFGWNGRPTAEELVAARILEEKFREMAIAKGLPPKTVSLVSGTGFRRALHAEGRAILNLFTQAASITDVNKIALMQVAVLSPNNQYYGIKKVEEEWATCSKCARLLEIVEAQEEMLTPKGWRALDPARTFQLATSDRVAPRNFWDTEKELLADAIRESRHKLPARIETKYMSWIKRESVEP